MAGKTQKTKIKSVSLDQLKQKVEEEKIQIKALEQANADLAAENNIATESVPTEPVVQPVQAAVVPAVPVAPVATVAAAQPGVTTAPVVAPAKQEAPYPPVVDPAILSQGDKILGLFGYIHLLCIFPLILKPNSPFCQFHGKQGLVITLIFWGMSLVAKLFGYPWVADQILIIPWLILAFYGIVMAFRGEAKKIPLFGDLAKMLNW